MAFIQGVGSFLSSWKFVLLFYIVIAIVIYIYRKKFQVEGGFILLYRTDFGIKFIDRLAEKHREFWKLVGYTAIGTGFIGMIVICGMLLKGLYNLVFVPSAPPTLSLVIPGVQIPGSPVYVPFWYGIIALFIVIVVHEFGHGVIAKSHGLKIKNTGFGFFGPLPLAFVEPDEKQIVKQNSVVQQSIFGAGPFFNVLLCAIMFLLIFLVNISAASMTQPQGFQFTALDPGYPAELSGLLPNVTYNMVNGALITNINDLTAIMDKVKPNETVVISNGNTSINVTAAANPTDPSKAYLGIKGVNSQYILKNDNGAHRFLFGTLMLLSNPFANDLTQYALFQWILTLSLGIGLANLLPLGPVDGGRMLHRASIDINGKKKGVKIWAIITIVTVITMILLIFVPIIKHLLLKI